MFGGTTSDSERTKYILKHALTDCEMANCNPCFLFKLFFSFPYVNPRDEISVRAGLSPCYQPLTLCFFSPQLQPVARECWSSGNFSRVDRVGVVCSQVPHVWHLHRHVWRYRSHVSSIFDHSRPIRHRFWLVFLHHVTSPLGKCVWKSRVEKTYGHTW